MNDAFATRQVRENILCRCRELSGARYARVSISLRVTAPTDDSIIGKPETTLRKSTMHPLACLCRVHLALTTPEQMEVLSVDLSWRSCPVRHNAAG